MSTVNPLSTKKSGPGALYLRAAFLPLQGRGRRFESVNAHNAGTGEIDGTIDGQIAVEIGVGSPKQIRASVLDLIFHPYLVSRSSKWLECSTSAAPSSSVAQWKR